MTLKAHTDRSYETELQRLRDGLLLMAGHVEEMIADSVQAFLDGDLDLARRTIERDRQVNQAEVDNDRVTMVVLAKRNPVASDLRFLTQSLKMVTDLERIGDLAVNICERVPAVGPAAHHDTEGELRRMGQLTRGMVRDVIDAFVAGSDAGMSGIFRRDDEVDALYVSYFRRTLDLMVNDPATVELGVHLLSVAKWLERIGDHAQNLAEQVIYMVNGQDVRHPRLTQP